MTSCEIKFDSPDGIYYSGQSVSAQIELKFEKPKKLRSIFIIIKGRAKCSWIKKYRAHKKTRKVAYEGDETYMESLTYLQGNETSEPFEVPAGVHTFNTTCVLPSHLPSSYEGTAGSIRYFVKVVVDRPWKFDHTFKTAFTVLKQYDLNFESSLRLPVELNRTQRLCCWPCASGPFKWCVKLPQSGYVPGQKLPIHIDIVNHSGTSIRFFRFYLRKITLFHATNPKPKTRRDKEVAIDYKLQQPAQDYGDTHVELELDVPSLPPTNIMHSKTIQVTYELKICAITTGFWHDDIEIKIPISVGTVPLYPVPLSQSGQLSPGGSTLQPVVNPNYPPPCYEEAFNGTLHIIKEADDDDYTQCKLYAPKYPVYKLDQLPAFSGQINAMYPPGQYQTTYYQSSPAPYPASSGSSSSGLPYPPSASSPTNDSHRQLLPSAPPAEKN